MKNNSMNAVKGFIQLSRAFYGKECLNDLKDITDEVTFGYFYPEGGTEAEMKVKWEKLFGKVIPHLSAYDDSWRMLSQLHDLIDLMGQYNNQNISPEKFCELLKQCGFGDMTETDEKHSETI